MLETLISLPPPMADWLHQEGPAGLTDRFLGQGVERIFVGCDPRQTRLGSGGGTVHLLWQAWRDACLRDGDRPFATWLGEAQRLVLHAGGQSRRLPAYAAIGKVFTPLPLIPGLPAQSFDQVLGDVQVPRYAQVLHEAGDTPAVLVGAGDVWLDFDPFALPRVTADLCGIGMRVSPEMAQHFGVFFLTRQARARGEQQRAIDFFLQKPDPDTIRGYLDDYDFLVDTGLWLLSPAAVLALFAACGWDGQRFATPNDLPENLGLYDEVGPALGTEATPSGRLSGLGTLTHGVVALENAAFHHLGTSRQLLEFTQNIQRHDVSHRRRFTIAAPDSALDPASGDFVWLDNCRGTGPILVGGNNLLRGLPVASSIRRVPAAVSVDAVPVTDGRWCLRIDALDASGRGAVGAGATIAGIDAAAWLAARGAADLAGDVFGVPLYPVLDAAEITQDWLDWFLAATPAAELSAAWRAGDRLSSAELPDHTDFTRWYAARDEGMLAAAENRLDAGQTPVFTQDVKALARFVEARRPTRREALAKLLENAPPLTRARLAMALSRERGDALETRAFAALRDYTVTGREAAGHPPHHSLKPDQIVWARSPARLDLAGGWTDTPPYCFEFGGCVLNVGVLLNGQPPIQCMIRRIEKPFLRVYSIDLGYGETIATYDDLRACRDPRQALSLPRAALSLAGFLPEFSGGSWPTLEQQLADFGGGLELTLLCAIPKGSGLGTSSILAATILGALNRACDLGWDEYDLFDGVLATEQLLTTGGGWQDQAGAIFRGLKLIETTPGAAQTPTVRYLPEHLFAPPRANGKYLLYYTGLTRMAKGILQDIVRNMLAGDRATIETVQAIGANARRLHQALTTGDEAGVDRAIARSWRLNCVLDSGTCTPGVQAILDAVQPDLAAAKLLGAGGGGYLFMAARDLEAGERIRARLDAEPPNDLARFVDFQIAASGTQVTVS